MPPELSASPRRYPCAINFWMQSTAGSAIFRTPDAAALMIGLRIDSSSAREYSSAPCRRGEGRARRLRAKNLGWRGGRPCQGLEKRHVREGNRLPKKPFPAVATSGGGAHR
ncbi:hypothetical protein ACLB2K_037520 [Fragaria x ananassa]